MKSTLLLKNIVAAFVISLTLASPCLQAAEAPTGQAASTRDQVVIQVSDDDAKKWNLALNNAKNVQQELGTGNVDIEIVVYGPGISMLKFESPVASRIDEALKAGIKIVACENTMKAQKLGKPDMLATIDYVPAGIVEIIRKQKAGYVYIRP